VRGIRAFSSSAIYAEDTVLHVRKSGLENWKQTKRERSEEMNFYTERSTSQRTVTLKMAGLVCRNVEESGLGAIYTGGSGYPV
jgi:hypothetical protein